MNQVVKENVLIQLEHLRSIGSVSAALRRRDLQVHGWVTSWIEPARFSTYDATSKQFIPLE